MKKVTIVLGLLMLSTSLFAADSWTGTVADKMCAGNPAKAKDSACVKKCLDGGQAAVLVVDGKDGAVVTIANPEKIKGHEGHHVTVTGKLDGDKLTVATVKMVEEKKSDKM